MIGEGDGTGSAPPVAQKKSASPAVQAGEADLSRTMSARRGQCGVVDAPWLIEPELIAPELMAPEDMAPALIAPSAFAFL